MGLTEAEATPWVKNRLWLDLLARSGTPVFISLLRRALGPAQEKDLREALALAAGPRPVAEPLDWMETPFPRRWRLMGGERRYEW